MSRTTRISSLPVAVVAAGLESSLWCQRLALSYLLQIIREAVRHVSPGFMTANPTIPWNAIVGMRHKVVHDYMDVDEGI